MKKEIVLYWFVSAINMIAFQTTGFSQIQNPDSATITFKVNTAFVQDTLSVRSSVSIRGTAFGGDWSFDKGVKLINRGGDYWMAEKTVPVGKSGGEFIIVTSTPTGTGWDRHIIKEFEVKNDTTLTYYTTGLKETYTDPFTGASVTRGDDWNPLELAKNGDTSVFAVHFRVKMEGIGAFNSAKHTVTVRGSFNGWSAADTLKPEVRHDDSGQTPYEAEKYFFSKTILIPKTSAGEQKYTFAYGDQQNTNWETTMPAERFFVLSRDTTLFWKCFSNICYNPGCGPLKKFKISLTADLDKAINTNGFNRATDTLIARIGFLGTALKTVDVKFETPLAGTEYSGDTGPDSLESEYARIVLYRYYKKNAAGEFEEFYWDYYNSEPGVSAPKYRKLTLPQSGDMASSEDILYDVVSSHRQPFFKNMNKVGVPAILTLTVNLIPAHFLVECMGKTLEDFQAGPLVVSKENFRSLDLFINGPAIGGWKAWHADSLGEPRKMKNLGQGQWSIDIYFNSNSTVSQEFKLGIGGADNEAGNGRIHVVNLFPASTSSAKVQFGEIEPSRYKVDNNNYWNFANEQGYALNDVCPTTGITEDSEKPLKLSISAYPNPFNPATLITYSIPQSGKVSLKVFDLLGRQVALLEEEIKSSGTHQIPFRGDDLASGIYLVRMESGSKTESVKVILLK